MADTPAALHTLKKIVLEACRICIAWAPLTFAASLQHFLQAPAPENSGWQYNLGLPFVLAHANPNAASALHRS